MTRQEYSLYHLGQPLAAHLEKGSKVFDGMIPFCPGWIFILAGLAILNRQRNNLHLDKSY